MTCRFAAGKKYKFTKTQGSKPAMRSCLVKNCNIKPRFLAKIKVLRGDPYSTKDRFKLSLIFVRSKIAAAKKVTSTFLPITNKSIGRKNAIRKTFKLPLNLTLDSSCNLILKLCCPNKFPLLFEWALYG